VRPAREPLGSDCYRESVPSRIGAPVPPLGPGKWLTGLAVPLMSAWIAAAIATNTDVFGGPFWIFVYMVVVGIGLFVWGATTEPISPPTRRGYRFFWIVLEELALGVAAFGLFWAFLGN
jgi:hypothetical protein